ncbi:FtsX-like permease family protein [Actinomadura verrucosospora]|uniref:ABC-type transport system involved in lipoprotein release permease component-like protein n=1 Tax=Actinomadura verrucosospora TaxID=46165 RepID=A0A7D3VWL8_ACTVE|nr:FtsX-like permease family protein [Actinomadura verrucosospora]QKG20592.1 ABC-type transport system involved in lipoprotein release permease component-like protein [Actinomadura verrucosospora]
MGRTLIVARLALRDLRRRPAQALLLVIAVAAAATTLTLGLLVRDAAGAPWQRTRAATAAPDAVATVPDAASLRSLAHADGVAEAGRPQPTLSTSLRTKNAQVNAVVQGRDTVPAGIDRPYVTAGRWLSPGTAVVERAFAGALRVRPGDRIALAGRDFRVAGIAVTAARAPYPSAAPGLVWLTRADTARLASATAAGGAKTRWTVPLRLADPAAAPAFAAAHPGVRPAQDIGAYATSELHLANGALLGGTWALAILAGLCVALLVGARLAEQGRRVGLLKAAGATPALVTAVLMAEHLALALAAGVLGLLAGWAVSPALTGPNAGLLGTGTAPAPTPGTAAAVLLAALAVTAAATAVPALRGARTSTALALTEPLRGPGRRSRLVAPSGRLPVPLLLGVRVAARRPRRTVLAALSTAVTVAMVVAALALHRDVARKDAGAAGPDFVPGAGNPATERIGEIVLVLSLALLLLAAVNAVLTAWTTSLDTARPAALTRALGATPGQVTAGLAAAQLLPAAVAAVAGVPLGLLVHRAALALGGGRTGAGVPAAWLAGVVPAALLAIAVLTAVPVRRAATRPVARVLSG